MCSPDRFWSRLIESESLSRSLWGSRRRWQTFRQFPAASSHYFWTCWRRRVRCNLCLQNIKTNKDSFSHNKHDYGSMSLTHCVGMWWLMGWGCVWKWWGGCLQKFSSTSSCIPDTLTWPQKREGSSHPFWPTLPQLGRILTIAIKPEKALLYFTG